MNKPILLTGSHRSGSTWAGTVISWSENIRYIHEPFNITIPNRNMPPFNEWFKYISEDTPKKIQHEVKYYLRSFYGLSIIELYKRFNSCKNFEDVYLCLADYKGRISNRTILKDPIAIMSAEWIFKNIGCDVIILVRHPAAFIASLVKMNWHFDFNNFYSQKNLIHDKLKIFENKICEYSKLKNLSIVEQGILIWNSIHTVILEYKKSQPKWIFVKHENLSKSPQIEFKKIFDALELKFTSEIQIKLKKSTEAKQEDWLNRDSITNIKNWKKTLSIEEVSKIKNETKEIWKHFYSEEDWS